jgi:hypothetical protein
MATYNLAVPYCFINEIRSPFNDTLVAAMALTVTNAQGGLHQQWPAQSKYQGDHKHHTTVAIDLSYADVDVPDPTPEAPDGGAINWTFLLTNTTASTARVNAEKLVLNFASALTDKFIMPPVTIPQFLEDLAAWGVEELLGLLAPGNCDGVVATLGVSKTAKELAQLTADPVKVNCPGTDSHVGCGANSNYDVFYVIAGPPPPPVLTTVPQFEGQSPATANQLANTAGLLLRTTIQHDLPRGRPAKVISQNPAAGTQVPQGSTVSLVIEAPVVRGLPP